MSLLELRLNAEVGRTVDVYRPTKSAAKPRRDEARAVRAHLDERRECANPACSRSRIRLWRGGWRPIFEGRWGCSRQCVESIVESAVRREFADGSAKGAEAGHRHRLPLGLLMLAQGWITHPQLQHALAMQQRAGTGRIGQWLVEECGLAQELVVRALGMQWNCPVLTTAGFDPAAMALVVPKVLVEASGMVPLRIAGERILYLGFEDRLDASAALAIERMSGLKVESGLVGGMQLADARRRLCGSEFVDAMIEQVAGAEAVPARIASALVKLQPKASRLARVHRFYWLRMWLESGAMSNADGGIPRKREDVLDLIYTVGM